MEAINWHTFLFLLFALITCGFAIAVVVARNIVRMAFYLIVSLGATSGLFFLAGADFVAAMQLMIYVGGTLVLLIFGVMLTAQGPFISMKTRAGEWILGAVVGGSLLAVLLQTAFSVKEWRADPRLALAAAHVGGEGGKLPHLVIQAKRPGAEFAGFDFEFADVTRFGDMSVSIGTTNGRITAAQAAKAINDSSAGHDFTAFVPQGGNAEAVIESGTEVTTRFIGPPGEKTATALGMGLLGARVDQLDQPNERLRKGMSGYLLPFEIVSMHLLVVLIGAAYLARTKKRASQESRVTR